MFRKKIAQLKKGFTIVEMIVVVAIMALVTTLVLFNNNQLNSAILVSNTAYEIGLIVRESQVAGLGVQATNEGFSSSHGVHFDISDPYKVISFADKNKNGIYDQEQGEMTQEYTITNKRAGAILGMCQESSLSTSTTLYCYANNTDYTTDIVFNRPNPEAFFKIRDTSEAEPTEYSGAIVINVGFINNICRSIIVEKTGAVSIDQIHCPPMINN